MIYQFDNQKSPDIAFATSWQNKMIDWHRRRGHDVAWADKAGNMNMETARSPCHDDKPLLICVCGCNGAGKTTMISGMLSCPEFSPSPVLDPDRIARESLLNGVDAGREAIRRSKGYLDRGLSHIRESTMTAKMDARIVAKAKQSGFYTTLLYIGISSPELAIARIMTRVQSGGHMIPDEIVRRRFMRSLANLPAMLKLFDRSWIFDNSGLEFRHFASFKGEEPDKYDFCPIWFRPVHKEMNLRFTGAHD